MGAELLDALTGEGPGPVFGRELEDLDITLLAWPAGHTVQSHRNEEVDVVTVVLAGEGVAIIEGEVHPLRAGNVLLIPKGVERAITSRSDDFRYLNVHKRRRRLMPSTNQPH